MLPSQAFHDAGELQTVVPTSSVAHPTGFPTYIIISKLLTYSLPFGEAAWKVNFFSILYSIATLFFVYLFLVKLTKEYFFSLIGVITLAFVAPFWNYAGMADTHTLGRLFLAIEIYIFLLFKQTKNQKLLYFFSFLLGFGLGNHLLLLYSIPGFALGFLFIKNYIKTKNIFISLVLFFLGLSVYLWIPLRATLGAIPTVNYPLNNWDNFLRHISGSDFQGLMYQGGIFVVLQKMLKGLIILRDLVTLPGVIVGIIGLFFGLRKFLSETMILIVIFAGYLLISTNYPTSDPTRYYLWYITIYSIFISLGAIFLLELLKDKRSFKNLTTLILFLLLMILPLHLINNNYLSVDKSKDIEAKKYSQEIFYKADNNAVILSWWNYSTPLWYRQLVLKERLDITLINANPWEWKGYADKYIGKRPIYIIEYEENINRDYELEYINPIFKVKEKQGINQ